MIEQSICFLIIQPIYQHSIGQQLKSMSQYKRSLPSLINAQLNYVITLANDLKKHILSSTRKNRSNIMFIRTFRTIEDHLQKAICEEYGEMNDRVGLQYCQELEFKRKTFNQIIGHGQFDTESEKQEQLSQSYVKSSDSLVDFRNQSFTSMAFARGPYRSYKIQEKLKVVKLYNEGRSYAYISRFLQIPQKNIVRWCKNGVLRKQGAGRKVGDEEMQRKVLKWMNDNFSLGSEIKSRQIRQKAMYFSTKNEFKSSKGWFKNFIRRHQLNQKYDIQ